MMRIVLNTSVFISAVLCGDLGSIVDDWRRGHFGLLVSGEIVREYLDVLHRPKLGLSPDVVDDVLSYVFHRAEFVTPGEHLAVVEADPSESKFLEAAIAGSATLIVSSDQHLLSLETYRDIPIVTPREFLQRLRREQSTSTEAGSPIAPR